MHLKFVLTCVLAAAVAWGPATRVGADAGDAIVGGVIGGVISGIIVNEANKNNPPPTTTRTVVVRPAGESAQRTANRETQTALNYFGYPAGVADGVMGRKSRAAISSYQTFMGFPVTGRLSPFQRDVLVGGYHRGIAGDPNTIALINSDPLGNRALLLAQRDILTGVPSTSTASASGLAPLPVLPVPASDTSLSSHCSKVSLMTNANGGFTDASSMINPDLVLNEQFCLARAYAMDTGEQMVAGLQGVTQAQVDAQCAAYGTALSDHVASLSVKDRDAVVTDVSAFAVRAGIDPVQLASTARICLSSGYRKDDMNVALGTALLLVVLGEAPYSELVGHHLTQGFGVSTRPDLATAWYQDALTALADGAEPVFAPNQPDRAGLLRAALYLPVDDARGSAKKAGISAPVTLPTFNSGN